MALCYFCLLLVLHICRWRWDLSISCSNCLLSTPSNGMYSPFRTLSLNKLVRMLFLAMIVYHRSKRSNTNPSVCHPLFLYSKFDPSPLKIKTIFLISNIAGTFMTINIVLGFLEASFKSSKSCVKSIIFLIFPLFFTLKSQISSDELNFSSHFGLETRSHTMG